MEYLAAETIKRGFQGRVTASHVCALSSYEPVHAAKVVALLAEAQVHVVTNPGVNLHLQGRFDTYPKRRGLTRGRSRAWKKAVVQLAPGDKIEFFEGR